MELQNFKGNKLTKEEKVYRMNKLNEEIEVGNVDKEFIPYLKTINNFDFIMTTQCCTGHNKDNLKAHIDFRCKLEIECVINNIIRPFQEKYYNNITIETEQERLRYIIWLENKIWDEQIKFIIRILQKISDKKYKENNNKKIFNPPEPIKAQYICEDIKLKEFKKENK